MKEFEFICGLFRAVVSAADLGAAKKSLEYVLLNGPWIDSPVIYDDKGVRCSLMISLVAANEDGNWKETPKA